MVLRTISRVLTKRPVTPLCSVTRRLRFEFDDFDGKSETVHAPRALAENHGSRCACTAPLAFRICTNLEYVVFGYNALKLHSKQWIIVITRITVNRYSTLSRTSQATVIS